MRCTRWNRRSSGIKVEGDNFSASTSYQKTTEITAGNNKFAEFTKLIVNLIFKNAKIFGNKYIQTNVCMV